LSNAVELNFSLSGTSGRKSLHSLTDLLLQSSLKKSTTVRQLRSRLANYFYQPNSLETTLFTACLLRSVNVLTDATAWQHSLQHNRMVSSVDCGRGGVAVVFQTIIDTLVEYREKSAKATT